MKTQSKTTQTKDVNHQTPSFDFNLKKSFTILVVIGATTFSFQTANAQTTPTVISKTQVETLEISGQISDEYGPLENTNVILKNTRIGTATDKNGAFKFPKPLKKGDVLVFSYIGYQPQEVVIKENNQKINVLFKVEETEIVLAAGNSNKPYKSKRRK